MINEYLKELTNKIRYKKEHVRDDLYRLYIKKKELEFLEKELKASDIIKEKRVDTFYLRYCFNGGGQERYNRHAKKYNLPTLKLAEFDLLKECFAE